MQKRLIFIVLIPLSLLLIPLIGMQFNDEINWTLLDFVIAGFLLIGTSFLADLVIRKIKDKKYRIIILVCLLVALILLWAELAVGIFGGPLAGS